eukprot:3192564-Alexandrium_andersonii.AAC.1
MSGWGPRVSLGTFALRAAPAVSCKPGGCSAAFCGGAGCPLLEAAACCGSPAGRCSEAGPATSG